VPQAWFRDPERERGCCLRAQAVDKPGIASGTLNTTQQFAGTAGIAAIGTVFFSALGQHPSGLAGYTRKASALSMYYDMIHSIRARARGEDGWR
jgi:hypothetical protein